MKMDLRKGVEERFKVLRNAVKPEICAAKYFHIKFAGFSHTQVA